MRPRRDHRHRSRVTAACAALAVIGALGTPAALASSRAPAVPPSGTASSHVAAGERPGLTTLGGAGWAVESSATATQSGAAISAPGFDTGHWLRVTPDDAGAPGTEIGALLQNGACPDVFYSTNMAKCFGTQPKIGAEAVPRFAVPWWFRTDFDSDLVSGQEAGLVVNGVVGKADVWVDGHEVATSAKVTGAYTRFDFDVTGLLRKGRNSLAIEMYPNDPATMFTLDDVDWNQIPPDNNTGIEFPVQLRVSDALGDGDARVVQQDSADLSSAALTVKTDVTNHADTARTGVVTATVAAPSGGARVTVRRTVTVAGGSTSTVTFTPSAYPALTLRHPRVWWPYRMGAQPLYTLTTSVSVRGVTSGSTRETFGIRTVTSRLVGASPEAPQGVRQYLVNGTPIVVRGGGFAQDMFLRYSSADTARQIALLKNLGLNTIRLEGHEFPQDFYQQMDAAGIMIDAGYQCCDAWAPPSDGSGVTAADYQVMYDSALTLGQDLRDHPSVVTFEWSDNPPTPKQEAVSLRGFRAADFDQPLVSSAEYNSSPQLGPSGEKEGPYDYVPPVYWYDTSHYDAGDSSRTNVGGAWGFDSEESAGDTVPTLDSIRRFLSPTEQQELWQNPDYHQYHANYEAGHGGYKFGTLYDFDTALAKRYGSWSSLDEYVEEAQVQDYENTRAQFEAFVDHSTGQQTPSTGTIYWQVNKGWPTLLWDLYNEDGDQAGSYFGAQQANQTLHAIFTQDDHTVTLDNLGGGTRSGLTVEARVYDTAGTLLDDTSASGISLAGQQVRRDVLHPKVPADTTAPAPASTYFVELLLRQGGAVVDRNVYWQSTQQDEVDWNATEGNPQATMTSYADLAALQSLPEAHVAVTASSAPRPGPDGADRTATVTVTNTSSKPTVGFFLRADVRRGNADGTVRSGDNQVTSTLWSDNDITLWPGESQRLTVTYRSADLRGATPVVSVSGWNVPTLDAVVGSAGHVGKTAPASALAPLVPAPLGGPSAPGLFALTADAPGRLLD